MSGLKRWRGRAAAATSLAATAALALTLLLVGGAILFKPWLPEQLCVGVMITPVPGDASGTGGARQSGRGAMIQLDLDGEHRSIENIGLGVYWLESGRQNCVPMSTVLTTQPLVFAAMVGLYFGSFFVLLWIFMVLMPGMLALGLALGLAGILIAAVAVVGVVALPAAPLLILLWWLLRKPAQAATPPPP